MGWTSYHANYYKKNGEIDRKAECDAYWQEGLKRGHFKVLRSSMVGSTYYAAVKPLLRRTRDGHDTYEPIPEEEQNVCGAVFLTAIDMHDFFNFAYKDMNETYGPAQTDCPIGILDLLADTNNESAIAWRKECRESAKKRLAHQKARKKLHMLESGDVIEFSSIANYTNGIKVGDRVTLEKREAGNTVIWTDGIYRWKEAWIPDEFQVQKSRCCNTVAME